MSALTSSGRSRLGRWDAPATVSSRAPPIEDGNVRGDALHVRDVLVPHDHERRAAHIAEPFVDRRVEDCFLLCLPGTLELVRAEHHLAHARTELPVDLVRRTARPVDPLPQARLGRPIDVAALERLFLGGPAGSRLDPTRPSRGAPVR